MPIPDESSEQKSEAPWTPVVASSFDGPHWHGNQVQASLDRVARAPGSAEMAIQAQVETMVLVHSIRRILLWTAVIIPLILIGTTVALAIAGEAAGCTPSYYKTC